MQWLRKSELLAYPARRRRLSQAARACGLRACVAPARHLWRRLPPGRARARARRGGPRAGRALEEPGVEVDDGGVGQLLPHAALQVVRDLRDPRGRRRVRLPPRAPVTAGGAAGARQARRAAWRSTRQAQERNPTTRWLPV